MIHNMLTHVDVLIHGPYKGWTVKDVLMVDPDELIRFTEDRLEPYYNVSPAVLREAYELAQDKLGWDEFMALWNRSE